jgi:hypothetical protein
MKALTSAMLGQRLGFRPVDEAGFVALPALDHAEAEDEQAMSAKLEAASYEMPAWEWRPIPPAGEPASAPRRFIDGSLRSKTIGIIRVAGRPRPLVMGAVGALELRLNGRHLVRQKDGYRIETVLCMAANGIETKLLLELSTVLSDAGVRLVAKEMDADTLDFEVLRRRAWDFAKDEMEEFERALLLGDSTTPALADGLLERRLVTISSQQQPVVGVVKQILKHYLPAPLMALLYDLGSGERSPAFLLKTKNAQLVSWYLRLGEGTDLGPGQGLVRLAVPLEYLERRFPSAAERTQELSALSNWLRRFRCRELSYARSAVSLEPIVRAEEQLHALLPSISEAAAKVRRLLSH